MGYAENTNVSVEQSKREIETILRKFGARNFVSGVDDENQKAVLQFDCKERRLRFTLPLPDIRDFSKSQKGRAMRSPEARYRQWERACRERWRALFLAIKAKMVAVECGISEFEDEFLANIVAPDGQTISELLRPQIAQAYAEGKMPKSGLLMLTGPGA